MAISNATKNMVINELQESGFTNVKFDMEDCHAYYFTYDGGEAKYIHEEEICGVTELKEDGSEDWYYWAQL